MSENPETSAENQLSNELFSMKNLLGGNSTVENEPNPAQNNDISQNQAQVQKDDLVQTQENNQDQNPNPIQNQTDDNIQNENQDLNQDQTDDSNQNLNQDSIQDQPNDNNQDQHPDSIPNQEKEQIQNQENQTEGEEADPTKNVFATIDDELELLVPSKNSNSNNSVQTKTQPPKPIHKSIYTKKRQHAVLTFLEDKPKTEKKITIDQIVHIKQATHNFSPEEITQAADNYLKTDKIQMDDPMVVSEIIEELTSRYIDFLSKNEYFQAQNILNKIQFLRDQFRTKDAVLFMEQHLEELKTKKTNLETELKSTRTIWKEKQKEFDESCQKEMDELQEKQQNLWEKMEKDWSDPSRQRKYSKESKALLLGRQAERYMMLVGDLEGAELMKKKNKQLEKTETVEAYNEMSNDFENARTKLTKFFEKQEKELDEQQRLRKISLKRDELDHVALIRKKIDILDRMINDESNPTYKEKKILHSRLMNSAELPMIQRTAKNISAKNKLFMKTAQISSKPLQLPPLKMAPRPTKKAKSNLARPIAH